MDGTHVSLEWWHVGLGVITIMLAWIARLMDHWRKFVHATIKGEIQPIIDKVQSIDRGLADVDANLKKLNDSMTQTSLHMERRVTQIETRCSAYHENGKWKHVRVNDGTD